MTYRSSLNCLRRPLDLNTGEYLLLTLASLIAQDTALILQGEPTRDFDAATGVL